MVTKPSIAVVITCYSGEPYFEEAAASAAAQTWPNTKLVFHDNGCKPSYRALIDRVAAATQATVVHTEVNRYGEGLRYDVLPFLTTDYVAILHDDDFYTPDKLADGMARMLAGKLDYLFTDRDYVDAAGLSFGEDYEEVNTRPIIDADFPDQHVADTYYRGLRLHFSTLIMRTELAKRTLMGDPYLPRITDSLFMQRLLLEEGLRGCALPEKLTHVRVHGENDMLYSKFGAEQRAREVGLLQFAEYFLFQELVRTATTERLGKVFALFPGIKPIRHEHRVDLLVRAALDLRNWSAAKPLMGAFCIHEAWLIDARRTLDKVRELSPHVGGGPFVDANQLTRLLYQRYIGNLGDLLGEGRASSREAELLDQLDQVRAQGARLMAENRRLRESAGRTGWREGLRQVFVSRPQRRGGVPPTDEMEAHVRHALMAVREGRSLEPGDARPIRAALDAGEALAIEYMALSFLDEEPRRGEIAADLLAVAGAEAVAGMLHVSPLLPVQLFDPTTGNVTTIRAAGAAGDGWRLRLGRVPVGSLVRIELPALATAAGEPGGVSLSGVYPIERPAVAAPFRWTGPGEVMRVDVPVVVRTPAALDLIVSDVGRSRIEDFSVVVNGREHAIKVDDLEAQGWRLNVPLDPDRLEPGTLTVELHVPTVFTPTNGDLRRLGAAISGLTLTMDPA